MDQVWAGDGAVTVRDVFVELAAQREIAYTTVMSTMDNLHRKGWLERERDGKAYRYWAAMSREERSANLMAEAFHAGGDTDLVLSFFLDTMNAEESDRLRAALRKISRGRPVS
ncbi:transcriptional regulator BlaI [Mycolicibacterium tokaiense]|uniref:Transcriptional regulator BlaI n=2 Tax=Mycolicibacterium TaxID=1866885 RepID=A0A378TII0_9MYCO|nr:transcriptional regulator BlaI [Mycolicibacterium tokaiense]